MSLELLKSWPAWQRANAETVFASPAWRLGVTFAGAEAVLRRSDATLDPGDMLFVSVTYDDEPHVLGLVKSAFYPDLHLLWERRNELPREILLALVEKECGNVFQMLEDNARRQFAVKGLAAERPDVTALQAFELTLATGAKILLAQTLSPLTVMNLGKLENLDPRHPSIREMTREAVADYGTVLLTADEQAMLAAGDHILLPDNFPAGAKWTVDEFPAEAVHLVGSVRGTLTFAQLADGDLPAVPPPATLALMRGALVLATGELDTLGLVRTLRITSIAAR